MAKLYVRIDDRLIHGQIVASWCTTLGIGQIIAIDDNLASNEMLQSIMTMGVPEQYDPRIVTFDDAKKLLREGNNKNRLVIVRRVEELAKIIEEIKECEVVNIGNCSRFEEAIYKVARGTGWYIYLSDADKKVLEDLASNNIEIISQQLPQEKSLNWDMIQKSFRKGG